MAVALLCAAAAGNANAARWTLTPRLYVGESYSDNITLAPSNQQLDDFVSEVTPGISVRGEGARLKLNLDYNYQVLHYAFNPKFNGDNHQLQGNATANIIKDIFFVDARSSVSQQLVSPIGRVSNTNLNATGNRATIMVYGVSPYVRHHFGSYADSEVRYDFDTVSSDSASPSASVTNGDTTTLTAYVQSGRRIQSLPWKLEVDRSETTGQATGSGSKSKFDKVTGSLSYVFNRAYRVNTTFGYEDNTYVSSGTTSGQFWTLGGSWTPSLRTELTAAFGERYFGNTFFLKALHRHRRWVFTANYTEEPQLSARQLLTQQLIPLTDALGQPVFDPNLSSRIPLATNTPQLTNQVYIDKHLDVGLTYVTPRNTITVTGYNSDQSFQSSTGTLSQQGLGMTWNHLMSPRLTSGIGGSWETVDSGGGNQATRYELRPFMTYQLGRSISATLEYRYLTNDTDIAANRYTENMLSAFVSMHL